MILDFIGAVVVVMLIGIGAAVCIKFIVRSKP